MSKPKPTPKPPKTQAPSDPLTLADITVVWNDGEREHIIPGEKVALALDMAWRRIGRGMGTWDVFTDVEDATLQLKGTEQLLRFMAIAAEEDPVEEETLMTLQTILRDVRLRCEMQLTGECGKHYRVRIAEASAAKLAA